MLWMSTAFAAPLVSGERLAWAVEYMGMEAGVATATVSRVADHWQLELTTRSTGWVNSVYPIDDRVLSRWDPARGSLGYETRFREGRFQQDQEMSFGAGGIVVARNQLFDDGWRRWTDRYAAHDGVEDPVSAVWRLRMAALEGEERFPVFTGKAVKTLRAVVRGHETVGDRPAVKVEIGAASHSLEDVRGQITLWLSDDADRLPLRAEVRTKVGTVSATLR